MERYTCFLYRVSLAILLITWGHPNDVMATKFAGEFLSIGVGPRALSMGGAFVAVSDDATAGYWNPAGLSGLSHQMVTVMHSEQLTGLAYDYFAYTKPLGDGTRRSAIGLSIIRLGVDDIPITRLPDPTQPIDAILSSGQRNRPFVDRFVSDAEYAILLSVARRTSSWFSIGGNLKLIRKSVDVASAFGAGIDIGILIRPRPSLAIGVQVMNLTSTILTWNTGRKEYITPIVKTGIGYERSVPRIRGSILIAADVDILFEGRQQTAAFSLGDASTSGHIGLEYSLQHTITLRSGLDASGLTAGIGIRSPMVTLFGQSVIPSLDYAFVNDSAFGAVHRIGASLEF
jgi:hypothetical protein